MHGPWDWQCLGESCKGRTAKSYDFVFMGLFVCLFKITCVTFALREKFYIQTVNVNSVRSPFHWLHVRNKIR